MARDPLALDADTMRRMGYQAVDMLVDRIAGLPSEPVIRQATREALAALIDEPPPAGDATSRGC